MALVRGVGPVHPVAVALAGADAREVAVPVERACARSSGCGVSSPSSSNRHSSTLSACSENSEKLVPPPSQVAPSGNGRPGHDVSHLTSAPDIGGSSAQPSVGCGGSWVDSSTEVPSQGDAAGLVGEVADDLERARAARAATAASSSNSIASASPGGSLPARRRAAARRAQPARGSRSRVSFERSNVAGSCGSGISSLELRERGELAAPSLAGGVGDALVDVVGEELKRRRLAVLLAHEQHRHERRQQRAERGERPRRPPAAGRRTRGCRPGRGSARRPRTVRGGTSSAGAPNRRRRNSE